MKAAKHQRRQQRKLKQAEKDKRACLREKAYKCPTCEYGRTLTMRRQSKKDPWPKDFPPIAGRCPSCGEGILVPMDRYEEIRPQVLAAREQEFQEFAEQASVVMEETTQQEE